MRGKLQDQGRAARGDRLIPARAGKTRRCNRPLLLAGAHPRACGENDSRASRFASGSGSSPRVRGKLLRRFSPTKDAGLIPARAGKTFSNRDFGPTVKAHPRACGENDVPENFQCMSKGSSPRVRGKQLESFDTRTRCRLIPARAGKTR